MIEKIFLALDYSSSDEVIDRGSNAIEFFRDEFGSKFVEERVGVKINEDMLIGQIDRRLRNFKVVEGCSIFADMKISHGYDTGERIINNLYFYLPIDFVTVSSSLGTNILQKYINICNEYKTKIIAWTIHTKISPKDAIEIYNKPLNDSIYNLAQIASNVGCDAVVLEGEMLNEEKIRNLPIKKLVTGVRVESSDKGTQKRVTLLEDLVKVKSFVNYVVISSRYLSEYSVLRRIVTELR